MGGNHSLPIRKKRLEKGRCDQYFYVSCAMQGWRPSMEDRFANFTDSKKNRKFFGVYDGHAGAHTASQLSECLHFLIQENDAYKKDELLTAIENGFIAMDNKLADNQRIQVDISGSTGILLVVSEKETIYAAGLGDSRAVISCRGRAQELSKDHLPTDPKEYERIKQAGGFVANDRVNGSLAMSRAFGDFIFKQNTELALEDQGVCCRPDIRHRSVDYEQDEFMVIGSDGIWEVLTEQEVVDFIRSRLAKKVPLETVAMELLDNCITDDVMNQEGIGCDNMTCSIICISKENPRDPESNNNNNSKNVLQKTAQYMVDNTNPNYKSRNASSGANVNSDVTTKKSDKKSEKAKKNMNDFQFPGAFVDDLARKCQRSIIPESELPTLLLNGL